LRAAKVAVDTRDAAFNMNSCTPYSDCKPSVRSAQSESLASIVQLYLDHNAEGDQRYLHFYAIQPTLPQAITKATMAELPSGKRFSHQRRIPYLVLKQATEALLKLNYSNIKSFSELHGTVSETIGVIDGIGPLTIYDTAQRIGVYLKLSPEDVYLHAGVIKGAKALGMNARKAKLPKSAFPLEFQKLSAGQIEDCLCIYKKHLEEWARNQP
jgi:hypothetical protein